MSEVLGAFTDYLQTRSNPSTTLARLRSSSALSGESLWMAGSLNAIAATQNRFYRYFWAFLDPPVLHHRRTANERIAIASAEFDRVEQLGLRRYRQPCPAVTLSKTRQ